MLCAKYQEAGLCDRNYFVTPTPDSDPYMSPLRNAGDTKTTLPLKISTKCNNVKFFDPLFPPLVRSLTALIISLTSSVTSLIVKEPYNKSNYR